MRQGMAWGKAETQVVVESLQSNKLTTVIYPGKTANGKFATADPATVNTLASLKQGEIVDITVSEIGGQHVLQSIKPYHAKPGEDEPGVFVLQKKTAQKVGKAIFQALTLEKLLQQVNVLMPYAKDATTGKLVQDATMAAEVAKFKEGDLVFVRVESSGGQNILRSIEAYVQPAKGEIVKYIAANDKDPASYPVVEVSTAEGSVTFRVPGFTSGNGHFIADAVLDKFLSGLKSGQKVDYRMRSDNDSKWITWVRCIDAPKGADKVAQAN